MVYGVPATKLQLVLLSVLTCFSVDKTCEAKAVQGERLARVCYMNFSALQVSQFATERPMPASVPHFTNTGRILHKTTEYHNQTLQFYSPARHDTSPVNAQPRFSPTASCVRTGQGEQAVAELRAKPGSVGPVVSVTRKFSLRLTSGSGSPTKRQERPSQSQARIFLISRPTFFFEIFHAPWTRAVPAQLIRWSLGRQERNNLNHRAD